MTETPNNTNTNNPPDIKEPRLQEEVLSEQNTKRDPVANHNGDLFTFSGMELRPVVAGEQGLGAGPSSALLKSHSSDGMKKDNYDPAHASEYSNPLESPFGPVTAAASSLDCSPPYPELVAPSGVAGAVVGFLMGGPIVAALAGFGSAYAVRKEGATGDAARALGEVALSLKTTGQEWEEKHHVLSKTTRAIEETDSDLLVKVKNLMETSWKVAVEFNQEHAILEKGVESTGKGFEYLSEKLKSMSKKEDGP